MKKIITLLVLSIILNSNSYASFKSELSERLAKVLVKNMDEMTLLKNFNTTLAKTRANAFKSADDIEFSEPILSGELNASEHFVLELVSSKSSIDQNLYTNLRLTTNTKNPAIFNDMFQTLKTGPAFPKPLNSKFGERGAVFMIDTKNMSELNKRLAVFLSKAKGNSFNNTLQIQKTRTADILPFRPGSK